ncbi:NAD(P)/FAD-dependent oxidoreductase [Streptomyces sp. NPDC005479]|uniref:phytoene desaturase family protein n=1 Tax=unclassified Streptomyces TaxID=2593676 RepID=UPI00339F7C37
MTAAGSYDAVVIGGGHNGLVAALYLARAGWSVAVLERNATVGGAIASGEVTLPGFVHDLYSTNQNVFLGSRMYADFGSDLSRHGLRFHTTDHPYANAFPDGSSVRVYSEYERTIGQLAKRNSGDAEGFAGLYQQYKQFAPHLFGLYGSAVPSSAAVRQVLNLLRHHGLGGARELTHTLLMSTRELGSTYTESQAGLLPVEPLLVVGQTSAVDPTRAPAGRHVVWIQIRTMPSVIRGDAAGTIRHTSWPEAVEPMTDRVLTKLEHYAPGTRSRIVGTTAYTPQDLESANPNLVGGDSVAGSHHLSQNFFFRPMSGHSGYRTAVPGPYLTGAATWPGAGNNATSGRLTARQVLKDVRLRGWASRSARCRWTADPRPTYMAPEDRRAPRNS